MRREAGELGDAFLPSLIPAGEEEEAHYQLIQRSLCQNWHEGSHHQLGSVKREGKGEDGKGGRKRKGKEKEGRMMKRGESRRWWNDGLSLARHTSESTHIFTVMSVPSPVLIIAVLLPGVVVLNDIMVTLGVNLHSKGTLHVFYSHHVCGSCNHMYVWIM